MEIVIRTFGLLIEGRVAFILKGAWNSFYEPVKFMLRKIRYYLSDSNGGLHVIPLLSTDFSCHFRGVFFR
jgi:hypothetical protein